MVTLLLLEGDWAVMADTWHLALKQLIYKAIEVNPGGK
jgi:hypothetical protein